MTPSHRWISRRAARAARAGVIALVTAASSLSAVAASFCTGQAGTFAGMPVITTGSGCGTIYPVPFEGLTGALFLGNTNTSEACTFNFGVPVQNVYVEMRAHTCNAGGCEKAAFNVDGSHYAVTPAVLVTPVPSQPGTTAVSIDGAGDLVGSAAGIGDGSATLTVARPTVSQLQIDHTVLSANPAGTLYSVCFTVPPAPQVILRKTTTAGSGANNFGFNLTGVTNPTDSISVTGAATVASPTGHTGTVGTPVTLQESSVPAGWPTNPSSVSCLDGNAAISGNAVTNLATLSGNTASLPGSVMRNDALISCTFVNTPVPSVSVTKSAPATVTPGATLAYTLSVSNSGPAATGTTVVVREQLPPGVVATSVGWGSGVTGVNCGTLPSAAGAALTCSMTVTGGIPALTGVRTLTLNTTAPVGTAGTVLTNYASTAVIGSGTTPTAPGAACVSDASVSCANASTSIVPGLGVSARSGVRTVVTDQLSDGVAQDVLEAIVRDVALNPVPGTVVTFGATTGVAFNGGAVGAAGTCTTDAAGLCQVTATTTVAGTKSSTAFMPTGALTGAFTVNGNAYQSSPASYRFLAPPRITVRKTTTNGSGSNTFGFALSGVTNTADSITLTGATSVSSAVVHTGTIGTDVTLTESSVPAGWPATPVAVSCLDSATATSGNATTNLATLTGNVATLPGSVVRGGAVITCTVTNTAAPSVALTKSAPATVAPGGALAYGLSLVNSGAIATGTSVVVREQLPPGVVATSVGLGAGVTGAACGTLPSAAGALMTCTLTITGGIPAGGTRSFTLNATAPTTAALASTGTVLTNYANTNVVGSGTAATAPGPACVPDAVVSCANASTTVVAGAGAGLQSGVRTVTDNQLANGTAQDVLEAMVRDVAQNPVAGAVVTFAATANVAFNGGAVGAAGTCTTNAAGRCQVTTTSTVSGLKSSVVTIAAGTVTGVFSVGGDAFHASPVTYSFVPGASAAQSGLRIVTDNALADGVAQDVLQAFIRDAAGNPVGAGVVVSFGATPNVAFGGGAVGAAGSCTTTAASTCQVTAASTVAAIYGATAVTVGGSPLAGSFTASGNTYLPSPQPYRFVARPTVTVRKVSVGNVGSFGFTGDNGLAAQSLTTVTAGTAVGGAVQTLTVPGVATTLTEDPLPANYTLTAVSCTGLGAGGTATPDLSNRKVVLDAAATAAGSNIVCTFTNSFGFNVGGRVFNDNGVGAGTANDGLINGSEAGIAGVTVRLTNCAATVLASAVTDGAGRYTLAVPFATAVGSALCVEETNPATPSAWTSTGASAGGTALPSGTATTVAGTAYTYTRTSTGTPDRIAFAWNGSSPASLDFGDVAPNTFATDGAKTGLPGSTVSYPHTFKAQTGGVVRFGIPGEVATPALAGWSGKIFADTGCTGALQAGAALLYPPSAPVTVVAGQSVCLVMQTFVPATAMNGYSNNATVQASFDFSNAVPALGASYTVHDITTVSDSALELKKEVRNVTQGGPFGINNQAKSGETLEYRITYTNNGVSPIGNLSVNDTTPSYTGFVGAQAGSTPATLTACQKTTPANPVPAPSVACSTAQAAGGTGALAWHFTGVLSPGSAGTVLFTVKVD